ncbi:hypothetical protein [Demequina oxidasica]|uniref:hypothetical protein n=1 Tax=Demequina oxidasica TaxID=676199 RepID=UPI000782E0B9|nr:hypothetical protein [Demequina oxidasica]
MTKAMNTHAIAKATGLTWAQWVTHLDALGGRELNHTQLATAAHEFMPPVTGNREWWSQGVAVAYEQKIGRRVPGQRADGTFEVSASRTLPGSLDDALAAWISHVENRATLAGRELTQAPTTSSTAKWRRWRGKLEDGRAIGVDVGSRGDKSVVTVTVSMMESLDELESTRASLKALLSEIK